VPAQARFYEKLADLLPAYLCCFHPATNGTEATEVALKAAMHATGRRRFLALDGGYHGRTFGALAVSAAKGRNAELAPFSPEASFLPFAQPGQQIEDAIREAEALLKAGGIAALILEPIQATAGMRRPAKGYLEALADLVREHGCLLIVDEVFCGFGRSGRRFGFERCGLEPDLVILAKSLGGSLPAGLLAGRADILQGWKAGTQSSTFQLHPLSAVAGSAFLDVLVDEGLVQHAERIGGWFEAHCGRIEALPNVQGFRGLGAMWGVVMDSGQRCQAVRRRALDLGLVTWECGVDGEVIGLAPPLTIDRAFFERGLDRLCRALDA
jgi:4-aminobutyrate aminotransferase-like enzyme